MNIHFDVAQLKTTIDALLVQYPALNDDETLRADMLEGCTNIEEVLSKLTNDSAEASDFIQVLQYRQGVLNERANRFRQKQEVLRSIIQSIMERANLNKMKLPEATISVSWREPSPIVTDETKLPEECVTIIRKPNMTAIRNWTDNVGSPPDGCSMSNGRSVLSIRTK